MTRRAWSSCSQRYVNLRDERLEKKERMSEGQSRGISGYSFGTETAAPAEMAEMLAVFPERLSTDNLRFFGSYKPNAPRMLLA
jgi:hypothetical protein